MVDGGVEKPLANRHSAGFLLPSACGGKCLWRRAGFSSLLEIFLEAGSSLTPTPLPFAPLPRPIVCVCAQADHCVAAQDACLGVVEQRVSGYGCGLAYLAELAKVRGVQGIVLW